ncbi:hypothetical protein RA2_04281 [Roseovarius sp. A-2]|uniref:hypothetical protein n=1 Tax=Roseovarius sp. A-2 TaxID=1570360 RepID=UPI0009B53B74|nr:hypothetical protein [Roseovarius sp. A-2]GAW37205.1 hypothetical protein RA2_04281 [Roseovarius sp. A-2]
MTIRKDVPKDILDAAEMADFLRATDTENARQFVQAMVEQTLEHEAAYHPRKRKRRQNDQQSFEKAVAAYAGDLMHHNANQAADGFMYRPCDREVLSETLVSGRHYEQLNQFWSEMNLIELTGYFQARTEMERPTDDVYLSRARRMRAKRTLLDMAAEFELYPDTIREHFPKQSGLIRPVTVRDEFHLQNGRRKPSRNIKIRGAEYDRQVDLMRELNQAYAHHAFNLADQPSLYRLFNRGNFADFSFDKGGRLYCASDDNWQSMDSETRKEIEIDGKPTVELDVRASHLAILYGLHGKSLDTQADPYDIDGIEREVVKLVFTAWTGSGKPPAKWPKKEAEKYAQRHGRKLSDIYKLKDVVAALRNRHPVLDKIKWGALDWSKLQFVESEFFLSAMLELSRCFEVPALPVHDSLIVRERDADLVEDILGQSYQRRLGFRPIIKAA